MSVHKQTPNTNNLRVTEALISLAAAMNSPRLTLPVLLSMIGLLTPSPLASHAKKASRSSGPDDLSFIKVRLKTVSY